MSQRLSEESLSCSVCLDILKEPVTLPCGHSYCKDCIQTSWSRAVSHSCPQCRQCFTPRPVLSKNTVLANLVEELKTSGLIGPLLNSSFAAPGDVSCDVCSGRKLKAVRSCLQCLVSFCDEHLQPHRDVAVLQRHQLVMPSDKLQENLCSKHNELKKLFCRKDQQIICSLCSLDNHKGHDTVSSATERTERQKQLETKRTQLIQSLQDKKAEQDQLRHDAQNVSHSAQAAVLRNMAIFREICLLLENKCSEVEQQIRAEEQTQLKQIQDLQEKLQSDITELKKGISHLDTLFVTPDHNQFLLLSPSLSFEETDIRTHTRPKRDFEDLSKALSALKDKFQHSLGKFNIFEPEPSTRKDFLRYWFDIRLDPNTAAELLNLSEKNRTVTQSEKQRKTDHPDRFVYYCQVLSTEGLTGRCYWEVELSGWYMIDIAVSYRDIKRDGPESGFGNNKQSWALCCTNNSFSFQFDGSSFEVPGPVSNRLGIYLDHSAGTLCFYSGNDKNISLIHKVQTKFTQPLFAGVGFYYFCTGDAASLVKLK